MHIFAAHFQNLFAGSRPTEKKRAGAATECPLYNFHIRTPFHLIKTQNFKIIILTQLTIVKHPPLIFQPNLNILIF